MPHGVAWSGDRPDGPEDARDRLLDAAVSCIQRFGREKTGLSDIASAAGVTRRTVYRYFSDRDALISAALVRGVQNFTGRARRIMEAQATAGEMIVAAGVFALREIPRDAVIGSIITDGESLLTEHTFRAALGVVIPTLQPVTDAAGWSEQEAREASELVMRLALSWVSAPNPDRDESQIEDMLRRQLLPALGLAGS
jgi:AcrR family transcriptional regulator